MKKKTLFSIALLAMTLVTTAAFAYFTWTSTVSGNTVSTGQVKFDTWGGPINVSGLLPGGAASTSFVAIQNTGDAAGRFKAFVSDFGGNTEIAHYVIVKVSLNPALSPYTFAKVYGPSMPIGQWRLDELTDPAGTPLNNRAPAEAMPVGFGAVYKVEISLDPAAGNDCMNKSMSCNWNWMGGQVEDLSF